MQLLTMDAVLKCAHGGVVGLDPRQRWVTITKRAILVEADPLDRPISACPQMTPATPPCHKTVAVDDVSYSGFVRIGGRRVCLDRTTGRTDWSKLGLIPFSVTSPGQAFVASGG